MMLGFFAALPWAPVADARRVGLLAGMLAVVGVVVPAFAEPADERTVETLVFVGELIAIEPMANP